MYGNKNKGYRDTCNDMDEPCNITVKNVSNQGPYIR